MTDQELNRRFDIIEGLGHVANRKLDDLLAAITNEQQAEGVMSAQLDTLTADVHKNTDLVASILQFNKELAAKIEDLKNDPTALSALAGELEANNAAIAAALVANTPQAPADQPSPTDAPTP